MCDNGVTSEATSRINTVSEGAYNTASRVNTVFKSGCAISFAVVRVAGLVKVAGNVADAPREPPYAVRSVLGMPTRAPCPWAQVVLKGRCWSSPTQETSICVAKNTPNLKSPPLSTSNPHSPHMLTREKRKGVNEQCQASICNNAKVFIQVVTISNWGVVCA